MQEVTPPRPGDLEGRQGDREKQRAPPSTPLLQDSLCRQAIGPENQIAISIVWFCWASSILSGKVFLFAHFLKKIHWLPRFKNQGINMKT